MAVPGPEQRLKTYQADECVMLPVHSQALARPIRVIHRVIS